MQSYKWILGVVAAFVFGVACGFLFTPSAGRYVWVGSESSSGRVLDTVTGRVFHLPSGETGRGMVKDYPAATSRYVEWR